MDWVKFLASAVVGLVSVNQLTYSIFFFSFETFLLIFVLIKGFSIWQVTVISSLDMPNADIWVIFAVLSAVIGYCAKTYFT